MTLAEFVAARLQERWEQANRDIGFWNPTGDPERVTLNTEVGRELRSFHLILRQVAAQRRTLTRHANCGIGWGYCDDGGHAFDAGHGCPDLADLAAPDQEHPDFNPAWKVETP